MELPIEIECFLIRWGFLEPGWLPGIEKTPRVVEKSWTPSYEGEEPPF